MTGILFVALFSALCILSSAITEALKKAIGENHIHSNILVAIVSTVIGWGGTAVAYIFLKIPFNNAINIVALVLMAFPIWLASMLGYDKVHEIINYFLHLKK